MNYCKKQNDSRAYHKQQSAYPLQLCAFAPNYEKTATKGDAIDFIKYCKVPE